MLGFFVFVDNLCKKLLKRLLTSEFLYGSINSCLRIKILKAISNGIGTTSMGISYLGVFGVS